MRIPAFILVICAFTSTVLAQSPITLTIDTQSQGYAIPEDFTGLSFETYAELPDRNGVSGNLFSPTNTQLITLFTNSGIRNLRLGGGTVENGLHPTIPSYTDIDNVFGFAQAAHLKVIYSFRLLNGDPTENAATAKYIWTRYRPYLDYFSIGNEPNEPPYHEVPHGAITNYAGYLAAWKRIAAAITNAVPDAKFTGPEAGGWGWVQQFARDEGGSGMIALITHHEYAGGKPLINHDKDPMPAGQAIDNMLSENWLTREYPRFHKKTVALARGLPCRMTEANDYLGGIKNASDAFASALWALDYMHWWAARGLAGVNFHNNQWLKTDTVYIDHSTREYQINPKAYAIRAFDLGSRGRVKSMVIGNTDGLNLTAYVVGDTANLYVTIINKEHGNGARDAQVTIRLGGSSPKSADVMFLTAPNSDAGATSGITLGGASITNNAPWTGQWKALDSITNHQCILTVPATSAALVKLLLK